MEKFPMELSAVTPNNRLGLPLTLPLIVTFKTGIPFACTPPNGGVASEAFWMNGILRIPSDLRPAHGR